VAEPRDCGRDDDCACGTHCALGACTAACTWNADCGEGEVCDAFGRCTPEGEQARLAGPDGQRRGTLRVDRMLVELVRGAAQKVFRVTTAGPTPGPVRVAAQPGLEVACGRGGAFGQECRLEELAADAPLEVQVRGVGGAPVEDVRRVVEVFAGGQRMAVGVRVEGSRAVPPPPRAGLYRGTARLVGAGLQARRAQDALPEELSRLELPVEVHVFPEQGGVYAARLLDARRTVFPAGAAATLSLAQGSPSWQLLMPSRQYLGEDVAQVPAGALDVHASGRMEGAAFRDGLLAGDFVLTFEGITAPGVSPQVRWSLTLARQGELPPGASRPNLEPRPVADVTARTTQPLPEEVAGAPLLAGVTGAARLVAPLCPSGSFAASPDPGGDLLCAPGAGSPSTTRQRAFALQSGTLLERAGYLEDCVRELGGGAAAAGDATAAGQCADRVRAVVALAEALGVDRARALGQAGTAPNLAHSRLALRQVQRWLALMALAGVEPHRMLELAPLFPGGPATDALRSYGSRAVVLGALQRSARGWDVLLHPRVGAALAALPPEALFAPDYRGAWAPLPAGQAYPRGEMALGLPASVLFTLTRQHEGMERLVEDLLYFRAGSEERQQVREELARFLPRSVAVFALAQGLSDAAASFGEPEWRNLYATARTAYGASVTRLVAQLDFLDSGRNPLGIDDVDLPLYRLGDQAGTGGRFSAVSDSLLGREDLTAPAIAPTLLAQAREAEGLARASISALLARDLAAAQEETGKARRLEDLHRRYGEQITSLCGQGNSLTILSTPEQADPDRCFLAPGCRFSDEGYAARRNLGDTGYEVCLAAKLRERFGAAVTTGQAELDRQLDRVSGSLGPQSSFFSVDFGNALLSGFQSAYEGTTRLDIRLPSGVDTRAVAEVEALCESARQETLAQRPAVAPASCEKTDDCPVGFLCDVSGARTCYAEPRVDDPACYTGSLGELALAIQGASTDVEIARSELEEYSERYDNAVRGCLILQQGNQAIQAAIQAHNATLDEMATAKLAADTVAKTADRIGNLFSLEGVGKVIGGAVFGAVAQAAESTADTLQLRMDQVERAHEGTLQALEGETAVRQCLNEAEAELVGTRSASLRIRRQSQELARQVLEYRNAQGTLAAAVDEGLASLQSEALREVSPAHVDHWLDANLDLYAQRMRRARRALYLATLAVEYELQFSSSSRAAVLAARTPAELERLLQGLRDQARRGAPMEGGNPTELLTALSLRKNLLQVADRSAGKDPGWHRLSEVERFRRILVDPRYAVRDAEGRYLGQEIPFTIQPLGTLGLADTGGIPLLSGLNCSERLWSVNATVKGKELMNRTDSSIVTLQLRKRNTFSSQWCGERGAAADVLQTASTRPSRNLFVDPYSAGSWAQDASLASLTNTREALGFSRATIQARINLEQRELERVAYTDGASRALAGRGVFGDYTLFIPATSLSLRGSAGLRLERVEDVLLRLDYVAAERE
jgi:hypothetical protein